MHTLKLSLKADPHSLTKSDLYSDITHILSIIDSTLPHQSTSNNNTGFWGEFQSQINEMLSSTVLGLLYGFVEGNLKRLITRDVRDEYLREVDSEVRARKAIQQEIIVKGKCRSLYKFMQRYKGRGVRSFPRE